MALLSGLGEPFPPEAIKRRKGAGGRWFEYPEGHTVIRRLNAVARVWDWRIVRTEWRGDLLMVTGELTVPGLGTRTGIGVQLVPAGAGEDLVKGASTDALKKAATLFGVALDLYGDDYEAESATDGEQEPQQQQAPSAPSPGPSRGTPYQIATGRTHDGAGVWKVRGRDCTVVYRPDDTRKQHPIYRTLAACEGHGLHYYASLTVGGQLTEFTCNAAEKGERCKLTSTA